MSSNSVELDDRELQAFFRQYRTSEKDQKVIRERFCLVGEGEEGEHFECRYCGRRYSVVEVCTIVDPTILLEHPASGFGFVRAPLGSGQYWKNQCALEDPK